MEKNDSFQRPTIMNKKRRGSIVKRFEQLTEFVKIEKPSKLKQIMIEAMQVSPLTSQYSHHLLNQLTLVMTEIRFDQE